MGRSCVWRLVTPTGLEDVDGSRVEASSSPLRPGKSTEFGAPGGGGDVSLPVDPASIVPNVPTHTGRRPYSPPAVLMEFDVFAVAGALTR
jgi:hypothetical protein